MRSEWRRLAVCVVAVACSGRYVTSTSDPGAPGAAAGSSGANEIQNAGGTRASGATNGGAGHAVAGRAGTAGRGGSGAGGWSLSEAGVGSEGGVQSEGGIGGGRALVRHLECETPTELSGGYVRCDNGFVHRTVSGICPGDISVGIAGEGGGSPWGCGEQYLGYTCGTARDYYCAGLCATDDDCDSNQLCLCGDALLVGIVGTGQCVGATCRSDHDCAPGYLCVSSADAGYTPSFSCQSPQDECGGDDDCVEDGRGGEGPHGWACSSINHRRVCNVPSCSH